MIDYELKISHKKVKNIIFKIRTYGVVEVIAPYFVSTRQIYEILEKNNSFIIKKLSAIKPPLKLENGEFIDFLGKKYELVCIKNNDFNKNQIDIKNQQIFLYSHQGSTKKEREKLLEQWYFQNAKDLFENILNKFCKILNIRINILRIRKMTTRWGSCNHSKKYINLNLFLIKYPKKSIEAVILHELIHIFHPNHSKNFYEQLLTIMPDYKERIKLLNPKNN